MSAAEVRPIRIATQAWAGAEPATTIEETVIGLHLPWVELGGVRVSNVASAAIDLAGRASSGPSAVPGEGGFAEVTVVFVAPVEVVYVGEDGEPLAPGEQVSQWPAEFGYQALVERGVDTRPTANVLLAQARESLASEDLVDRTAVADRITAYLGDDYPPVSISTSPR